MFPVQLMVFFPTCKYIIQKINDVGVNNIAELNNLRSKWNEKEKN